jgi:hypothetical protein
VKSLVVTVSGSIRLLNFNWITPFVGAPVSPFAGLTDTTVGGTRSAAAPVVKVVVEVAVSALPLRSFTPVTLIV